MSRLKLITYKNAKLEMDRLENYTRLIENYEVKSIEQFIIKNYALTNSSAGVIKNYNTYNSKIKGSSLSREYILEVIKSPPIDELHKILRAGYFKKYRI